MKSRAEKYTFASSMMPFLIFLLKITKENKYMYNAIKKATCPKLHALQCKSYDAMIPKIQLNELHILISYKYKTYSPNQYHHIDQPSLLTPHDPPNTCLLVYPLLPHA